jgi:hypothetical protein
LKVLLKKTRKFYPEMVKWWEGHGFPVLTEDFLPPHTFVCYNDYKKPVYCISLYNTDAQVCWVGWPISNPEVPKEESKGCFNYLFESIEVSLKEAGYKYIFTTSATESVERQLKKTGFYQADVSVNQYVKEL